MDTDLNILIIEPNSSISAAIGEMLKELGFHYCHMATPYTPLDELRLLSPDLGIVGPSLRKQACLESVHRLRMVNATMPVLVFCEDTASTLRAAIGPFHRIHQLNPDLDPGELSRTMEKALADTREDRQGLDSPIHLVGQNETIQDIRKKVRKISDKDVTVLITGETGTGKELIARSIHYHSLRRGKPLVKISCGVLPDDLLESEVFGFQRGAFTGAHQDKPGRLELANGGTLFVDEIGNLSWALQAKFLQVLEEKVFARLGGIKDRLIDARVIAATNWDLAKKVREGAFRKDLFYRLNAVHIHAPPLRERKNDIPLLTHYFVHKYCFELRTELLAIPDEVGAFFLTHHWPGNVRELENAIRRAIVTRDWRFVFADLSAKTLAQEGGQAFLANSSLGHLDWQHDKIIDSFGIRDFSLKKVCKAHVSQVEREAIQEALKRTRWNRKKAAELLEVSYKTLLNRIGEYGLKP